MQIALSETIIRRLLLFGILIVAALGLAREAFVMALGLETPLRDLRQISLSEEQNLSSWYTSLLMTMASVLAWLAAICVTGVPAATRRFWRVVAILMLLCSIDETVSFHEVGTLLLPNAAAISPFLRFAWVVFAVPVLAFLGIWCLWSMRHLPSRLWWRLMASAAVFLTGAVGLELIDGAVLVHWGETSLAYRIGYVTEDILEMLGLVIFILAVFQHLRDTAPEIALRLGGASAAVAR